jgi:hypothetical protein
MDETFVMYKNDLQSDIKICVVIFKDTLDVSVFRYARRPLVCYIVLKMILVRHVSILQCYRHVAILSNFCIVLPYLFHCYLEAHKGF